MADDARGDAGRPVAAAAEGPSQHQSRAEELPGDSSPRAACGDHAAAADERVHVLRAAGAEVRADGGGAGDGAGELVGAAASPSPRTRK